MEWLAHNVGLVITLLTIAFGMVGTWVMYGARIAQLEKDRTQQDKDFRELRTEVLKHVADTTLHIDPHRDKQIWDDFKSEMRDGFERIEKKIERIMIQVPPPRA